MRKPSTLIPLCIALSLGPFAGPASPQEAAAATESAAAVEVIAAEPESISCPALQRAICHREADRKPETICVKLPTMRAHLAHGDSSFPCGGQPGAQAATTALSPCSAGQVATCHQDHTPGSVREWTTICLSSSVEQKKHLDAGDQPGECPSGPTKVRCADSQLAMCHNGRDGIPAELLCVPEPDVKAHLGHGDRFGPCDAAPTATPAEDAE